MTMTGRGYRRVSTGRRVFAALELLLVAIALLGRRSPDPNSRAGRVALQRWFRPMLFEPVAFPTLRR